MITISQAAIDSVCHRMADLVSAELKLSGRALLQHQSTNIELVQLYRRFMPIPDPLIISTHDQLLEIITFGQFPEIEELTGAQAYLHLWYAVLEEQARRSWKILSRLDEAVVNRLLPQMKTRPFSQDDYQAECTQLQFFINDIVSSVAKKATRHLAERNYANVFLNIILAPLVQLMRMLNVSEAKTKSGR